MPRTTAADRARVYLAGGRIVLTSVTATEVVARVRGDGTHYDVTYRNGEWHCTCPARQPGARCAHGIGTRLVVSVDLARPGEGR